MEISGEDSFCTPSPPMRKRRLSEDSYSVPPVPKKKRRNSCCTPSRFGEIASRELAKMLLNSNEEVFQNVMQQLWISLVVPPDLSAERRRRIRILMSLR